MMTSIPTEKELVDNAVKQYLTSDDFNGYHFKGVSPDAMRTLLKPLCEREIVAVRCGDLDMNPFIRPFTDPPVDIQLKMLAESTLNLVLIYPTKKELAKHINPADYNGRPFTLELAKGNGQLDYRCFDLSVLEFYRNDPRYYYKVDDIFGSIYAQDESHHAMPESDRVFLQTFGFGYDKDMNRAVVAFLRYLHDLTPEHQQIWNSKLLSDSYSVHPDYFNSSIRGMWSDHTAILDAFGAELHHANEMCTLMGKPHLFHNTFWRENRPKGFTFLIRPTMKEFYDFIHLLDKALSDNLNKEFFKGDIPIEEDKLRKDGKIEVRQIGTLRLLEQWLAKHWIPQDPGPLRDALAAFKEIRRLRQIPAHSIKEDIFDQTYFKQQRDLIVRAYKGVRLLRLMFSQHPNVTGVYKDVPECLFEGRIRTF